jgi:septum formation protein
MSNELEKLKKYRIILGSQSSRRQKLLGELGIKFNVFTKKNIIEDFPDDMAAVDVPLYLADLKSKAYESEVRSNTLLITADTIVICDNEIVGKPKSLNDAKSMLKKLSGKQHTVITGVSIRGLNKQKLFSVSTEVFFAELSEDEINYYVNTYKPVDKAGSYGIQEWIGYIGVQKIVGSYFNVMGLPVFELYKELKEFVNN